jgi:hypothetical protein
VHDGAVDAREVQDALNNQKDKRCKDQEKLGDEIASDREAKRVDWTGTQSQ